MGLYEETSRVANLTTFLYGSLRGFAKIDDSESGSGSGSSPEGLEVGFGFRFAGISDFEFDLGSGSLKFQNQVRFLFGFTDIPNFGFGSVLVQARKQVYDAV